MLLRKLPPIKIETMFNYLNKSINHLYNNIEK